MSEKIGPTSWDIAVGVCGGILMAGVASGLCAILLLYGIAHGLRFAINGENVALPRQVSTAIEIREPETTPSVPQQHFTQQHMVRIPAKSVEDCLRDSNGVVDMAFAKCRQPHQELRY